MHLVSHLSQEALVVIILNAVAIVFSAGVLVTTLKFQGKRIDKTEERLDDHDAKIAFHGERLAAVAVEVGRRAHHG